MNNADMPAWPQANEEIASAFLEHEHGAPNGLTKREHFAAMAMQGLCASIPGDEVVCPRDLADEAVNLADAMLVALEKTS